MRWWWVRCYGGPLDQERIRVSDPRPPSLMVPEPPRRAVAMNTSELPECTDLPRVGEYKLDRIRRIHDWSQMFEHSREIAYRWEGWR